MAHTEVTRANPNATIFFYDKGKCAISQNMMTLPVAVMSKQSGEMTISIAY